jgi:hypothetical protein
MPSSIVLQDAAATPVSHTFLPIQDGPVARFINETGAVTLAGQETLEVEVIRPKTDAAQQTGRVVIWDPVEGSVDGQTKVLYGLSAAANFKFPPGSSLQQKKDIVKMLSYALTVSTIVDAVVNGKPLI